MVEIMVDHSTSRYPLAVWRLAYISAHYLRQTVLVVIVTRGR